MVSYTNQDNEWKIQIWNCAGHNDDDLHKWILMASALFSSVRTSKFG